MSPKIEARTARGMRDFLPDQMVRRQYVIDVISQVFEEFGFEPLNTPAIEMEETLKGKYGKDAERLMYSTTYGPGEERLSLRYDLSVPLCRVIAMYPDLPIPFKRYQIAPVWRADRPQRGRYREFYQCDADTVGSGSMLGDAETVAVTYTILKRLGFKEFTVHINNRKILNGMGEFAGVPKELQRGLYQAIDKLSKIGLEGVRQELLAVGIPDPIYDSLRRVTRLYLQGKLKLDQVGERLSAETLPGDDGKGIPFPENIAQAVLPGLLNTLAENKPGQVESDRVQEVAGQLITACTPALRQVYGKTSGSSEDPTIISEMAIDKLLSLIQIQGENAVVLGALRDRLMDYPSIMEGVDELEEMCGFLQALEIPERNYSVDVSMVRGLEYYTGPVYETIVEEANIGSITGGGRFDNLIGMFTDRSLPATGTTIGIERIIVVMEEQNMFPPSIGKTSSQVLVTLFDPSLVNESLKVAVDLRQAGLRTQTYFDPLPLREQIGYAAAKGIPILVILGPDEAAKGQVTLRDLRTKKQETILRDRAVELIKSWLNQV
jgi:histidyl-tRNA synthetase